MGVTGLWKLVEASGKPIPLETLENKVLAIDISIWLHQVVKGYQDNKGGQLPNAHLLGLFNRICKLLYFRIKPIFVFDGGVPELKRQTIAKRSQQKTKIQSEADRLEKLLLESLGKERLLKHALGDAENLSLSPPKLKTTRTEERDDMFMLPPIEEGTGLKLPKAELEDDDDEDFCPKKSYDVNINQIDVTSNHFKSLPADIRHDILTDIKDTRKQNSWARLRELPVEQDDFSTYQMSRLLRRRQVQIGLEAAEKEMGGKCWSLSELESLLSEDGVLEIDKKAQKIASDENTRFLLVRDIAKAMHEAKREDVQLSRTGRFSLVGPSTSSSSSILLPQPSTSNEAVREILNIDDEEMDLQRAIQLSLGNDPGIVEPEPDGRIKLNPQQRQKFGGTIQAHGLIKGFMMEYAEMNGDDVQELMEATQMSTGNDELNDSFRSKFPNTDDYVLYGTPKKNESVDETGQDASGKSTSSRVAKIFESDSDDDFVEIQEEENSTSKEKVIVTVESNLLDYSQEDDIFADVFETSTQNLSSKSSPEVDVPDVEVASISSDDDTLPYDIPQNEVNDTDFNKETESGFVSEDRKPSEMNESSTNCINLKELVNNSEENNEAASSHSERPMDKSPFQELTENEKLWADELIDEPKPKTLLNEEASRSHDKSPNKSICDLTENEKLSKTVDDPPTKAPPRELTENEMLWADEVIEILDDAKLKTPVKINREHSPPPAKVASPFFVNRKTPSSKKKSQTEADVASASVAKSLFTNSPERTATILEKAVQDLRSKNTSDELMQMKDKLAVEQKGLVQERNKMDRMGTNITESMSRDCKELLKLFGIPYIESPMEAEAQCAFLNMISLTDGTISDDSDIWLFGGQTVYKNFFVQKKIVMEFRHENIEQMFHLDRNKLIQLAMLVGSDYTVGIRGIGAVTALEILAAFPPTPAVDGQTDEYQSLVSSLRKFREWFQNGKQPGPGGRTILKSKLKNVELFEGFPNLNVARAYLEPVVDTDAEKFTWGMPETESLVEYAKAKLGWTRMKTEEILAPVMKRLNEKKQATIKDYFKSQVTKKFFNNQKLSKRVQQAVGKMGGDEDAEEEKPKKARKRKAPVKKTDQAKPVDDNDLVVLSSEDELNAPPVKKTSPDTKPTIAVASTSKEEETRLVKSQKPKAQTKRKAKEPKPSTSAADPPIEKKRAPRIPNTKQVIPQREKEKEKQKEDRQNAIEIFKKAKDNAKKS